MLNALLRMKDRHFPFMFLKEWIVMIMFKIIIYLFFELDLELFTGQASLSPCTLLIFYDMFYNQSRFFNIQINICILGILKIDGEDLLLKYPISAYYELLNIQWYGVSVLPNIEKQNIWVFLRQKYLGWIYGCQTTLWKLKKKKANT